MYGLVDKVPEVVMRIGAQARAARAQAGGGGAAVVGRAPNVPGAVAAVRPAAVAPSGAAGAGTNAAFASTAAAGTERCEMCGAGAAQGCAACKKVSRAGHRGRTRQDARARSQAAPHCLHAPPTGSVRGRICVGIEA